MAAELDGSGNVLRRYVHGPGTDTPIVWYEGATLTTRNYLHADERGSVIATTNSAGAATVYIYGPYGEPGNWGGSRFVYTGQTQIPEAHLYYYKARIYSPSLGRFLQTDPIGTKDDLDLYTYTGDDPLNKADPSGEDSIKCTIVDGVAKGCVFTADNKRTTTVTYTDTTHRTDADGNVHEETTSFSSTYDFSISKEGLLSRIFYGGGNQILHDIEGSLSNITGTNVSLHPVDNSSDIPYALAGASAWMRTLGGLGGRSEEKAGDVARDRGASGSNIKEMGHWTDTSLKDLAKAANNNEPGAAKALKIVKEAQRLSKK